MLCKARRRLFGAALLFRIGTGGRRRPSIRRRALSSTWDWQIFCKRRSKTSAMRAASAGRRRHLPRLDDVGLGLDDVGGAAGADGGADGRLADGHLPHHAEPAAGVRSAMPGPSCSATSRCWCRSSSGTTCCRRCSCRCARCRVSCWSSSRSASSPRRGFPSRSRPASRRCRKGQRYAGLAMGLTLPQTYRYVLLPMAFRIVIPPLTSESMNIVKNSSVAFAVSIAELTMFAMQAQEETSRGDRDLPGGDGAVFRLGLRHQPDRAGHREPRARARHDRGHE